MTEPGQSEQPISENSTRLPDVTIGGKSPTELETTLAEKGVVVSTFAEYILKSPGFTTLPDQKTLSLAKFNAKDLGLEDGVTTEEIYEKAKELGWDLCPAEVGPYLALFYKDIPRNSWVNIAMEQIPDSHGIPSIFRVDNGNGEIYLHGDVNNPGRHYFSRYDGLEGFVFSKTK